MDERQRVFSAYLVHSMHCIDTGALEALYAHYVLAIFNLPYLYIVTPIRPILITPMLIAHVALHGPTPYQSYSLGRMWGQWPGVD